MVKTARTTADPDWLFRIPSPTSPAARAQLRALITKFLTVADSYKYKARDGTDLDPAWEYRHPRTTCDHSQSEGQQGCQAEQIVVPEDADTLVRLIKDSRLSIVWQRESAGPVNQAEYDTADTF